MFVTGVYAVHRANAFLIGLPGALLVGAAAGTAAAVVAVVAIVLLSIIGALYEPTLVPLWSLVPLLQDSPFLMPASSLFFDLPQPLPFPWVFTQTAGKGLLIYRIPWTLPLFLPLGAALAVVAVITKNEILLALCGGIFVIEALSVMAQVVSFKMTGKRVLKMALLLPAQVS